jgi:hypothetical protein
VVDADLARHAPILHAKLEEAAAKAPFEIFLNEQMAGCASVLHHHQGLEGIGEGDGGLENPAATRRRDPRAPVGGARWISRWPSPVDDAQWISIVVGSRRRKWRVVAEGDDGFYADGSIEQVVDGRRSACASFGERVGHRAREIGRRWRRT